jgi:hypothetical protein
MRKAAGLWSLSLQRCIGCSAAHINSGLLKNSAHTLHICDLSPPHLLLPWTDHPAVAASVGQG